METLIRMSGLVLLAVFCAVLEGFLVDPPDPADKLDEWAVPATEALVLERVLWVDGRSETAFSEGHFPGSVNLTLNDWDSGLSRLLSFWDPDSVIVVYCDGHGCESSRSIAARLREELGVDSVFWLVGGWPELQERNGE